MVQLQGKIRAEFLIQGSIAIFLQSFFLRRKRSKTCLKTIKNRRIFSEVVSNIIEHLANCIGLLRWFIAFLNML